MNGIEIAQWADRHFGDAPLDVQIARAHEEFSELLMRMARRRLSSDDDYAKAAEEMSDVVVCLARPYYQITGKCLWNEGVQRKMETNTGRSWVVEDGVAQHVENEAQTGG